LIMSEGWDSGVPDEKVGLDEVVKVNKARDFDDR
jgi:hypothetical protein